MEFAILSLKFYTHIANHKPFGKSNSNVAY